MLPIVGMIAAQAEGFHDDAVACVDGSFVVYCLNTAEVGSMITTDVNLRDVIHLEELAMVFPLSKVEVKYVGHVIRVSAPCILVVTIVTELEHTKRLSRLHPPQGNEY